MAYLGLAEFIDKERATIVQLWGDFASTLLPAAAGMSAHRLRDHADDILTAIVADLQCPQTAREQIEKSEGAGEAQRMAAVAKIHAELRAIDGFKIGQLVAEYRALRASVLSLWEKELKGIDPHGVMRFNEAIDEVLVEAVEAFDNLVEHGKNQYIGILGHDLRSPVATLIMGLSFLINTNKFGEPSTRVAGRMMETAERMSRMISDILDLTRTRFGSLIPIVPAPMDLAKMCRQVIEEFEILAPANVIRFTPKGNLQGEWDYDRLAQVLSNLIGNAIQYGASTEPIDITAQGKDNEVTIQVHNAGTLIPVSALSVIFDAGTRHGEKCKRSSGLGLGLFISKQVMIAHGGDIEVASNAAEGTTFIARLPRRTRSNLESAENYIITPPPRQSGEGNKGMATRACLLPLAMELTGLVVAAPPNY